LRGKPPTFRSGVVSVILEHAASITVNISLAFKEDGAHFGRNITSIHGPVSGEWEQEMREAVQVTDWP